MFKPQVVYSYKNRTAVMNAPIFDSEMVLY
jgi:hypothetical protein